MVISRLKKKWFPDPLPFFRFRIMGPAGKFLPGLYFLLLPFYNE